MNRLLVFALPGNETMTKALADTLHAELGVLETRSFPDGESYVRLRTNPRGRNVALVCTLNQPDEKFLRLVFTADAVKDLGAKRVGLVAPYLAYMRQDQRFHDGEAVTSAPFARLLSMAVDWLVTVDPHLHRRSSLAEIYSIQTENVHAGPAIADWIRAEVERPLIIGPDSESTQWVSAVAQSVGAPWRVLDKVREGDRQVRLVLPCLSGLETLQPVLVDDILSSGRTMAEGARLLVDRGLPRPVCIATHVVASAEDLQALRPYAARVASTNTIPNDGSVIDVVHLLARAITNLG